MGSSIWELPESGIPAAAIFDRAVTIAIAIFGVLLLSTVLVGWVVKMDVVVQASGQVEPRALTTVRSIEQGVVRRVLVQAGDKVASGDLLIELDDIALVERVQDLRNQLRIEDAKRAVAVVRLTYDTTRLAELASIAEIDLEQAKDRLLGVLVDVGLTLSVDSALARSWPDQLQVRTAKNAVLAAQNRARIARVELALAREDAATISDRVSRDIFRSSIQAATARARRFQIRAPAAGVVLTDNLDRLVGTLATPGEPLMEISSFDSWDVDLYVSERDVHRVRPGQLVQVEFPSNSAAQRAQVTGIVSEVARVAALRQATPSAAQIGQGQFHVVVVLPNSDLLRDIRTGMMVSARIRTDRQRIVVHAIERAFAR